MLLHTKEQMAGKVIHLPRAAIGTHPGCLSLLSHLRHQYGPRYLLIKHQSLLCSPDGSSTARRPHSLHVNLGLGVRHCSRTSQERASPGVRAVQAPKGIMRPRISRVQEVHRPEQCQWVRVQCCAAAAGRVGQQENQPKADAAAQGGRERWRRRGDWEVSFLVLIRLVLTWDDRLEESRMLCPPGR